MCVRICHAGRFVLEMPGPGIARRELAWSTPPGCIDWNGDPWREAVVRNVWIDFPDPFDESDAATEAARDSVDPEEFAPRPLAAELVQLCHLFTYPTAEAVILRPEAANRVLNVTESRATAEATILRTFEESVGAKTRCVWCNQLMRATIVNSLKQSLKNIVPIRDHDYLLSWQATCPSLSRLVSRGFEQLGPTAAVGVAVHPTGGRERAPSGPLEADPRSVLCGFFRA